MIAQEICAYLNSFGYDAKTAEDFIAKPFDLSVLNAKIQARLRRAYDFGAQTRLLEHRGVVLNMDNATLVYQDETVSLTRNEYRIFQTLMEEKGRTVRRDTLMERLWETDSFVDDNTLTVNMTRLRKSWNMQGCTILL